MSELAPKPVDQQAEQLSQAAALAHMAEQIHATVPSSAAEAQGMVENAAALDAAVVRTDNGVEVGGEPASHEAAQDVHAFAQKGVDAYRLTSTGRTSWDATANAVNPSDLSKSMQAKMMARAQGDSPKDVALAFKSLRQEAAARLQLDEDVAAAQGRPVAQLRESHATQTAREASEAAQAREEAATQKERARTEALDRVMDFATSPDSEFAAGPDVKRATGLSHTDIMALGFKSFGEMKAAAKERAAVLKEDAHGEANQMAADMHAAEVNAEMDAHRAAKEADRVAQAEAREAAVAQALAEAREARVEELMAAERFNRGSIAFDKNVDRIREGAVRQAEQDITSVDLPEPEQVREGMIVPRDEAAEQRASDLSRLLRAALMPKAPADEAEPVRTGLFGDEDPAAGIEMPELSDEALESRERGRGRRQGELAGVDDEDDLLDPWSSFVSPEAQAARQRMLRRRAAGIDDDMTVDFSALPAEVPGAAAVEGAVPPVGDFSEHGFRARIGNIWGRAQLAIHNFQTRALESAGKGLAWANDEKNYGEHRFRNRTVAGAVGVLAAGVVVMGTKLGYDALFHGAHNAASNGQDLMPGVPNPKGSGQGLIDGLPNPSSGGSKHLVDGYDPTVHISSGEGYQQALNNLVGQHGQHLSGADTARLYDHLDTTFKGHFFTDDSSYRMPGGGWGISNPGEARWNPAVIEEMNRWLKENGK